MAEERHPVVQRARPVIGPMTSRASPRIEMAALKSNQLYGGDAVLRRAAVLCLVVGIANHVFCVGSRYLSCLLFVLVSGRFPL